MAYQYVGVGPGGAPVRIFRADPALPVQAMKTYEARWPSKTHYRPATCAEVDCEWFHKGRIVGFDISEPVKFKAAQEFGQGCKAMGVDFHVQQVGSTVQFTFQPGQCPLRHKVRIEREPVYLSWRGDWRGNGGLIRRFHNGADFSDDWRNHQDKIDTQVQRG